MTRRVLSKRILAAGVLGAFMTASTACYGPFNLTRSVYHWNSGIKGSGEVNDKWMREFVFFGMIVIPVYMLSSLLDAFVFNSIQFWTGDNPIKTAGEDGERVAQIGEITVRWSTTETGTTVIYEQRGLIERRATIGKTATGYRLVDESGLILAEAEYASNGSITLLDGHCQVMNRWTSRDQSLLARAH